MSYDIEQSKRERSDLKKAFAEIFPLAGEHDLPWAACHIKQFLRDRIQREVEERTFHFTSRVVRILCEISPPKTHVEDMARIVVEHAKRGLEDKPRLVDAREKIAGLKKENDELRAIKDKLLDACVSGRDAISAGIALHETKQAAAIEALENGRELLRHAIEEAGGEGPIL